MHINTYYCMMKFEWDPRKAATNLRKHGVRFTDAHDVLLDERAVTIDDPHPDEKRFITVGLDSQCRVLVVSFTWRGERVRVISVRKATNRERDQYEQGT